MKDNIYYSEKKKFAYELAQKNKLFKKSRAIIIFDDKLLLIKENWNNEKSNKYVFPGGGVDSGETAKQTAVREAYEEYGAVVKPIKYLGKQYYNVVSEYNGEKFVSKRVEFYYVCECVKLDNKQMGIDGEFDFDDRTFEKIELPLKDLMALDHSRLNGMNENNFKRLIDFLKEYKKGGEINE